MQHANPSLISSPGKLIYRSTGKYDVQRTLMTCPDCKMLCLSTGKVKNGWYALCRCGTYIQKCTSKDDYYD